MTRPCLSGDLLGGQREQHPAVGPHAGVGLRGVLELLGEHGEVGPRADVEGPFLASSDHQALLHLVTELRREEETALLVELGGVGAGEHLLLPSPRPDAPGTGSFPPLRTTLLHIPPPSTTLRPLRSPFHRIRFIGSLGRTSGRPARSPLVARIGGGPDRDLSLCRAGDRVVRWASLGVGQLERPDGVRGGASGGTSRCVKQRTTSGRAGRAGCQRRGRRRGARGRGADPGQHRARSSRASRRSPAPRSWCCSPAVTC